jgi:hypothetical protein
MTGEQGSPSIGSHGCRYGQAPQLQAINEKHKKQKGMEPFIGQQIRTISKQHWWQNKDLTNTIEFIYQHEVPKEQKRDIMYGQFVCTVRPKKAEPN